MIWGYHYFRNHPCSIQLSTQSTQSLFRGRDWPVVQKNGQRLNGGLKRTAVVSNTSRREFNSLPLTIGISKRKLVKKFQWSNFQGQASCWISGVYSMSKSYCLVGIVRLQQAIRILASHQLVGREGTELIANKPLQCFLLNNQTFRDSSPLLETPIFVGWFKMRHP